jgi:hypothetical protein
MEGVKVVFGFFKKIERLFWQGKSCPPDYTAWKNRMIFPGKTGKLCKRPPRHGREYNCGGTVRITIEDSWDPFAL